MGQFCHDETWFEASGEFIILSKWGSECYGVDWRCGVAEVKGVAELLESTELSGDPELKWRSRVEWSPELRWSPELGGVRS